METKDTTQMKRIIYELKHDNLDFFDDFYDLTKKQVYYAIMMIVKDVEATEDIMQDTYLRFLNNINRYKDNTNVIAFIVTIARNLAINYYNRRKKEMYFDYTNYEDFHSHKDTPLLDLMYETLEGEELQVFTLHIIDELKHREIAKIMKKPLGTITWLYNKAVKKMKQKVGEEDE